MPEYKIFTKEPKLKRERRHMKYNKKMGTEANKRKLNAKNKSCNASLEQKLMMKRQLEREEYEPGRKKEAKKTSLANGTTKGSVKQKIKSGRVTKKK